MNKAQGKKKPDNGGHHRAFRTEVGLFLLRVLEHLFLVGKGIHGLYIVGMLRRIDAVDFNITIPSDPKATAVIFRFAKLPHPPGMIV